MIELTIKELQEKTINAMIDENVRFTISQEEDIDLEEEEMVQDVTDKVAILREQCLRANE